MFLIVRVEGKCYSLRRSDLHNWTYFDAVLSGRWAEEVIELPLTTENFLAWKKLLCSNSIVAYSSVAHVVDFFLPKDDSYLLRLYTDDQMTQEQRMAHYRTTGHLVRSNRDIDYPYLSERSGFHCNFFLCWDPVYWDSLDESTFLGLLAMTNVSEITGLMHDAWLRTRAERIRNYKEIPWWLVRWEDVVKVDAPNVMYLLHPSQDYPVEELLEPSKWPNSVGLSYTQLALVLALSPTSLSKLHNSTRGLTEISRMTLYAKRSGGNTVVTTGCKVDDAGLPMLFSLLLDGHINHFPEFMRHVMSFVSGDLLAGWSINTERDMACGGGNILMMVMANLFSRGKSLYVDDGRLSTKYAVVDIEDIPLVVKYGLETLGSKIMLALAAAAMKYCRSDNETQDRLMRHRATKFAQTVLSQDEGHPMVRLP